MGKAMRRINKFLRTVRYAGGVAMRAVRRTL
jgi:hypothetical protein